MAALAARLPLLSPPLLPELRLHSAAPGTRVSDLGDGGRPPYWAWPWPGGVLLARYLLDRPERVQGRHVLDLGSGCGIVAIAALRAGACSAVAIDLDRTAAVVAMMNAAANGVRLDCKVADVLDGPPPDADVVLVGDLFYEPALAERVTDFLDRCTASSRSIIVGDIGRAHLPLDRLEPLATMPISDFGGGDPRNGAVYQWRLPV